MTKRILAILLVLAGLLVCCGVLAESNIKDITAPVVGDAVFSADSVILTAEEPSKKVTVAFVITDDTPAGTIKAEGECFIADAAGNVLYGDTAPVNLCYNGETGKYEGIFTLDSNMPGGWINVMVTAEDMYGNAEKHHKLAQTIKLENQTGALDSIGVPVIESATLSPDIKKGHQDVEYLDCLELKLKAFVSPDGTTHIPATDNYICKIAVEVSKHAGAGSYEESLMLYTLGSDKGGNLFDSNDEYDEDLGVSLQIEPGDYDYVLTLYDKYHHSTVYKSSFTIEGKSVNPDIHVFDAEITNPKAYYTSGDTLSFSAKVTRPEDYEFWAVFSNTKGYGQILMRIGGRRAGANVSASAYQVLKGSVTLDKNTHNEGEYKLEGIIAGTGLDKASKLNDENYLDEGGYLFIRPLERPRFTYYDDANYTESIELNCESTLVLHLEGDNSKQLEAKLIPHDPDRELTLPGVEWESSDNAVAKVDRNGLVKAVGLGEATITVTSKDGRAHKSCKVRVFKAEIEKIEIANWWMELDLDKKPQDTFVVTIKPAEMSSVRLVWKSVDESIATVDEYGTVTAVSEGTTMISYYPEAYPEKASSVKVTVGKSSPYSVSLAYKKLTLHIDKKHKHPTKTIKASVAPSGVAYKLRWSTSDSEVATVKNGKIRAIAPGTCDITCRVKGTQLYATVRVRVVRDK